VTVFATALATLHTDANLAVPADYRRGGAGPAARVRVIRAVLEPDAAPLGFNLKARADTLAVRAADCPNLAPGDSFTLAPDTAPTVVVVTTLTPDAEGLSFTAITRRA
jgi:hypothetical protein